MASSANVAARSARDSQIVAKNSFILLGRYLGLWGLNALLVLFVPRYLGAQGLGQLQFAQSFVGLFSVGIGLGVRHFLVKEIARDRSQLPTFLGSAIGLRVLLSLAVLTVISVITELTGHSDTGRAVVYIMAIWMVVRSMAQLMATFLQGMENMARASVGEIAGKVFVAIVGIGLLFQGGGVVTYAMVLAAGVLVELAIGAWNVSRHARVGIHFNPQRMKILAVGGLPFLLLGFLHSIYSHIDVVMLRFMTGEEVVGWHAAALQIYRSLEFLPVVLTTALLPTLARMFRGGAAGVGEMAARSIGTTLIVMAPIGVGMSLVSRELIVFLPYPETFLNSVPVLAVMGVTNAVSSLLIVFGTIAAAVDRQVLWALGLLATVAFNIAVNSFAIPFFQDNYGNGGIGAAVATLASESLMVLIGIWLIPRRMFTRKLLFTAAKVGVALACMVAGVVAAKGFDLSLFPLVGIGAAVYVAMVFVTRAITRHDLEFLWSATRTRM